MKPTMKLRFVKRELPYDVNRAVGTGWEPLHIKILQQWWEVETTHDVYLPDGLPGEWRDVPIESETE